MAVASTVTVDFKAKTAKFENGLKKAKKQTIDFGKAARVGLRVAGAAAAGLTVALTSLTKASLAMVDQQQKMADRLGLTQKALVGLALAGEQTGTTQRNLQLAMQRSTRRIAEAAQGTGTAVSALKDLGLEAKALSRLSPDEAFIKLAGAFKDVDGQAEKVRLAFKLFDSEGVGLVNTLKLGEDGIRGFIQQAEDLGIALGRNQTKAIEDSNDAVNILKKSFSGLGNALAVQLAPAIKRAAESLTKFVVSVSSNVERLALSLKDLLGIQTDLDNLSLKGLRQEYALTQARITELNSAIDVQQKRLNEESKFRGRSQLILQLRDNRAEVDALTVALDKNIQAQKAVLNPQDTNTSGNDADRSGDLKRQADQLKLYQLRWKSIGEELQENLTLFDQWESRAAQAFNNTRTPAEKLSITIKEIQQQLLENPFFDADLAQRESQLAVDVYLQQMKRLKEQTDKTFNEMSEFQREAFGNMQNILSEFLFDPWEEGLDGMLRSFVDMLRRMVAQLVATKILEYFFGLFSNGVPVGGAGATVQPPAAIGGLRDGGRPVLVGERGPELFTPGASGSIRPMGAVTVQTSNTFGGSDSLNAATLVPILEENNKRVKAEILDAFDRGAFS